MKVSRGRKAMIPLENGDGLYRAQEIIRHIKENPHLHHHTGDEMLRCCLIASRRRDERGQLMYTGVSLSIAAVKAHFRYIIGSGEKRCENPSCICSPSVVLY